MSIVSIDGRPATRAEWLDWRRGVIGASETAQILGITPSAVAVYLDKLALLPDREPSEAMEWGLLLEDPIAEMYRRRNPGVEFAGAQVCVTHPAMRWMGATLDRVTTGGRIVELKAVGPDGPGRELGEDDEIDTLPASWLTQGHHQMVVAGVAEVTFAVFGPGLRLRTYRLPRNEDLAALVTREVREFWHDHVAARVPPADVRADDARTLARAYRRQEGGWLLLGREATEAAHAYKVLGEEINARQKGRDEAKARLLLSLGNAAGADLEQGWSVQRKVVKVEHKAREAYEDSQVRLYIKEPKS